MIDEADYTAIDYVEYVSIDHSGYRELDLERNWFYMHKRTGMMVGDRDTFEEWLRGIEHA